MRRERSPGAAWRRGDRPLARFARVAILTGATALASCSTLPNAVNPIEWYRSAAGINKNDDSGGGRNAENLAAGSEEPFPNLGTVPPPPDRVSSARERERLEQSLTAEREHAESSNEELKAGRSIAAAEPAVPNDGAPALPLLPPLTASPPPAKSASEASRAAPAPSPAKPRSAASKSQLPPKGSEEPPLESPGVSPNVHMTPEGETPRLAPPAPTLPPPFIGAPKVPPPPPRTAAITPLEPPPPSDLAAQPAQPRSAGAKASLSLGLVTVSGSNGLSAADKSRLAEIAAMQKQGGGTLRLVGYARRGSGADAAQQEMATFSEAIDRAKLVAQALTADGVASKQISVEAAPLPSGGSDHEGRTEVFLER